MTLVHGIPVPVDPLLFSHWMGRMENGISYSSLVYLQLVAHECRDKEDPDFGWSVITRHELYELTGVSEKSVGRCLRYLEEEGFIRSKKRKNKKLYMTIQLPRPNNINEPTKTEVEEALSAYPQGDRLKKFFSETDGDGKKKNGKVSKIRKKSHPSLRYTGWMKKKNIKEWRSYDFLGYYLHNFKEIYDGEDPDFKVARNKVSLKLLKKQKMDSKSLTKAERVKLEESNKNIWTKTLLQIGNFLKNTFDGDKDQLYNYLEWLFNYIDSDEGDWFEGSLSALMIFRERKNPFVRNYIGVKKKKKKKRRKWSGDDWDKRHR